MRCSFSIIITCRSRGGSPADADVAWGEQSSIASAIAELKKRGARRTRSRRSGLLSAEQHAALTARVRHGREPE